MDHHATVDHAPHGPTRRNETSATAPSARPDAIDPVNSVRLTRGVRVGGARDVAAVHPSP